MFSLEKNMGFWGNFNERKNHPSETIGYIFVPLAFSTPVVLPGTSHGWRILAGCTHGVARNQTRLSDFTFTFHFHALEKEMATHSSVLAWRIPGTGEPGGLPSVGSHRVEHDWSDLAAAAAAAFSHRILQGRESVVSSWCSVTAPKVSCPFKQWSHDSNQEIIALFWDVVVTCIF